MDEYNDKTRPEDAASEAAPPAEANPPAVTTPPAEAVDSVNAALQNLGDSLDTLETALRRVAHSLESLKDARRAYARLGWAVFALLPVTFLAQIILSVILSFAAPGWGETWLLWVVSLFPFYCGAVPLALWILRPLPALPPPDRPLGPLRFAALLPVVVLLTTAGGFLSSLVLEALSAVFGTSAENPLAEVLLDGNSPVLRDILIVLASPIVEECLFRKAVLDRTRVYGEKLALAVSALLFGMGHGNLSQFVYAVPLGLVFGYVYLRTGRLRYSIALHVFVNFLGAAAAPAVMRYAESAPGGGGGELAAGEILSLAYTLAVLLSCGGGVAILVENWRRIRFQAAERELPPGIRFRTAFANPGMILLALSFAVLSVLTLME